MADAKKTSLKPRQPAKTTINVKKIEVVDGGKRVAYTVVDKNGAETILVLRLRPIEETESAAT